MQGGAANAIGAAIAQTSGTVRVSTRFCKTRTFVSCTFSADLDCVRGRLSDFYLCVQVDRVFNFSDAAGRKKAFAVAEAEARKACVAAGAARSSVKQRGAVVERSEMPLPYIATDAVRIRVRVVGELDLNRTRNAAVYPAHTATIRAAAATETDDSERVLLPMPGPRKPAIAAGSRPSAEVARFADAVRTTVDASGDWLLSTADVDAIALGAGILAAGGGGNASRPALAIRTHMQKHPDVLLRVRSLGNVRDEETILAGTTMGSPMVAVEKLTTDKLRVAGEAVSTARGVKADALVCLEVGGGNGLELLYWCAWRHSRYLPLRVSERRVSFHATGHF